jgi:catechol 2,3-dioxygenase-like lactoylglutathione lyase family enzyme
MKLNHIHFATGDITKTREFYETYFGFREHFRLHKTLVLTNDHHFLLALDDTNTQSATAPSFHFGFCVESADAVRDLYERMKLSGVAFVQEFKTLSPNAVSFYCLDPHGNQVEVGWYRNL